MKILCVGLRDYKSGKTTLALALMRLYKEKGIQVCGFKPKSGNNLWYHWKSVKDAIMKGTLYGRDAKKLYEEMELEKVQDVPVTLINPVHRLWMPNMNEISFGGLPHFILDRITIEDQQIIAINNHAECPIDKKYFQNLLSKSEIIRINNREDLQELTGLYEKADKIAETQLTKQFNTIICESYADIGLPWNDIEDIDYVFTIKPFFLEIYEGERYIQSSKVISTLSIEQKTEDIIEPIKPLREIKIPPFANNIVENLKSLLDQQIQDILKDY